MNRIVVYSLAALTFAPCSASAQKQHAVVPVDIPYGQQFDPRMEEPVFAVCSKQGARILVSRDDGRTWNQTFLGTESLEDGGWHGTFAVYGMAATKGVIGVFSGWGTPGVYLGSDDAIHWAHLSSEPTKLGSVWGATGGNGVLLTSADQWRGMSSSSETHSKWTPHRVNSLLDGGASHHMICGFGDYDDGRFVVVGDNRHVFYSDDNCQSWQHSRIPGETNKGQAAIEFGNGVFLCSYADHVARSSDGGETWTLHDPGLKGRGSSWRGLSFIRGEFWLTAKNGTHARKSPDGMTWTDLPQTTPGGRFVESATGAIINVERQRYDIKRSEDGVAWESVFTAPTEDVSWDMSFAVHQLVNSNSSSKASESGKDGDKQTRFELSDKEKADGFQPLSDGKTFVGWEQSGNWVVKDGAFYRNGKGGPLTYVREAVPDDFELRFDWKVSQGCNSGVYYRPGQVEYQILDNIGSSYGENARQSAASIFFCMAPSKDATRPVGSWNTARVICKGTVIEHWLNGHRVLSFDYADTKWSWYVRLLAIRGGDLTGRGGQLWLQDHGQDVWFRHLRWRAIPESEKLLPDPTFKPLSVTGSALKKEEERVKSMLEK